MGLKSKGNYNINLCLKFDCVRRNIDCSKCIRFNYYMPTKAVHEIIDVLLEMEEKNV